MKASNKRDWHNASTLVRSRRDSDEMLDVLLALDRMLVEVSMGLYNVPRRERFTLRKQNRRLHDAVRRHLPRLLTQSRSRV